MTDGILEGKVVIITGGNSGIGRAASLRFAEEGAKVVVAARSSDTGEEVVQLIKADGRGDAIFIKTDVANPDDVERLVIKSVDHFGGVHVLYANSGVNERGTAPDTSVELWKKIIDVDLSGSFYLAKYGIPTLIQVAGSCDHFHFVRIRDGWHFGHGCILHRQRRPHQYDPSHRNRLWSI